MPTDESVPEIVEAAAAPIGRAWPVHSFVTSNPLADLEETSFEEAVRTGAGVTGGRGYPEPAAIRDAWEQGRIDADLARSELRSVGHSGTPEEALERLETVGRRLRAHRARDPGESDIDRVLAKWLASFLDEGRAQWSMPERSGGFYAAFRAVAPLDREIPGHASLSDLPDDAAEVVRGYLEGHPRDRWVPICRYHLTSMPGWAGFVKRRAERGGEWQEAASVDLVDLLAARLVLADAFGAPVDPGERRPAGHRAEDEAVRLAGAWLRAWEQTYREDLIEAASAAARSAPAPSEDRTPDAQMVFCIDTRSEIIRRHVEDAGSYRTFGYAGFFGIPMRYRPPGGRVDVDACPPILAPEHLVEVEAAGGDPEGRSRHETWRRIGGAVRQMAGSLQSNPATAFPFVESTGLLYGTVLVLRTLLPRSVRRLLDRVVTFRLAEHEVYAPDLEPSPPTDGELPRGLTLEARTDYAEAAFRQMGWRRFARLAVFTGHASTSEANPFASSLDCGACAGHPGGPSARVMAAVCNDPAVRERLRERGIRIPEETHFLAAEHDTTTDRITLYDDVPASHRDDVEQLRADLERARRGAARERAASLPRTGSDPVAETERRASDWAETRPEWGLAGNAAFVVGPRRITGRLDLGGRAFLHSYDWATDEDGSALEAIMNGPMVVTQWINSHYYFTAVDNAVFGSGSKITQNPVGNIGVYQGNGGDLLTGLPLQSVIRERDRMQHEPLRLTVVLVAPADRVRSILDRNDHLARLVRNRWMWLEVLDPERGYERIRFGDRAAVAGGWTEPVRSE